MLQYEDSEATREMKRIRALLKSSEFWSADSVATSSPEGDAAIADTEKSSSRASGATSSSSVSGNDSEIGSRATTTPSVTNTNTSGARALGAGGRSTAPRYLRECLEGLLTHCAPCESAGGRASSAGTPREESRLCASMYFSDADQFLVCLRAVAPLVRAAAQVPVRIARRASNLICKLLSLSYS